MTKYTKKDLIYRLELTVSEIEDVLTYAASIPFIGIIPSVIKIIMGTLQLAVALSSLVVSLGFCFLEVGRDIFNDSLRHINHGLANIVAGILQAIPIIGFLIWAREAAQKSHECSVSPNVYRNHESHKYIGYKTVRDLTWSYRDQFDMEVPVNYQPDSANRLDCSLTI